MKRCITCGEEKEIEAFCRDKTRGDGRYPICKACNSKRQLKQYYDHHEERKERLREDYYANQEERIQKQKDRYYADVEKTRERQRQNYHADIEKKREQQRQDYHADPRKHLERERLRRVAEPEKYRELKRVSESLRRARKRELPFNFTMENWQTALNYWGDCCAYCGRKGKLTLDHFVALKDLTCPGTIPVNVLPACRSCNFSKRHTPFDEWAKWKFGEERAPEILERIEAYFTKLMTDDSELRTKN